VSELYVYQNAQCNNNKNIEFNVEVLLGCYDHGNWKSTPMFGRSLFQL